RHDTFTHRVAVDRDHFEADVIEFDDVANLRGVAEEGHDQAADAVDFFVFQHHVQRFAHFLDSHRPRDVQLPGGVAVDVGNLTAFRDFSRDLFEQIFQRDDAGGTAVLVEHQCHWRVL